MHKAAIRIGDIVRDRLTPLDLRAMISKFRDSIPITIEVARTIGMGVTWKIMIRVLKKKYCKNNEELAWYFKNSPRRSTRSPIKKRTTITAKLYKKTLMNSRVIYRVIIVMMNLLCFYKR
jgi:hypothetical protein